MAQDYSDIWHCIKCNRLDHLNKESRCKTCQWIINFITFIPNFLSNLFCKHKDYRLLEIIYRTYNLNSAKCLVECRKCWRVLIRRIENI